jgi:lipopolysaccharide/colanic/teichoic acid biosynthesis glycosyltransferase
MLKRLFDFTVSAIALLLLSPIFLVTMLAVWLQDYHNPFYIPLRMGRGMKPFKMYKFRSMVMNADKTGVTSTAGTDNRVTVVGRTIRRFKLDELSQLINVFLGDMSLVGPRPQVISHIQECYTGEENHLLDVRPGITDISSIVFSDEGDILHGSQDPDRDYNRIIRPWKSRLGLLYIQKQNFLLDLKLIWLTVVAITNKPAAVKAIVLILEKYKADDKMIDACRREKPLYPFPPPGTDKIYGE